MPKTKVKKPKDTPRKEYARFVAMAREVEADESPDALDKAFKKIDPRAVKKVVSRK